MNQLKKVFVIVILSLAGFNNSLMAFTNSGGYDHGNGGDYIRELFEKSRSVASKKIKALLPCSFDGSDTESSAWILKNKEQLIDDIMNSPHYWTVDAQPTCGFTDRTSKQGIYFSYPTCLNSSNSEEKATFILIHESIHHFGFSDEQFADRVARAINSAKDQISCPEENSPFDVGFCEGENITKEESLKFFTPGESISNFIAPSFIRRRISNCTEVGGCGTPYEGPVTYLKRQPDGVPDTNITINSSFKPSQDFRFNISFDKISLKFPDSFSELNSVCIGNIFDKVQCYLNSGYENPTFIGKVTNRCFKMLDSHFTERNHYDGSFYKVETVWYSIF